MKREHQWDMFDVAVGACDLDQYLHQRYSENDLQSKFWVEKSDSVDELRPAVKGSKEQVIIPIQRPSAPVEVSTHPAPSLPTRPPWEIEREESLSKSREENPSLSFRSTYITPGPDRPGNSKYAESKGSSAPADGRPIDSRRAYASEASQPSLESFLPSSASGRDGVVGAESVRREGASPELEEAPHQVAPPSMLELLAKFHEATKAYEERAQDVTGDEAES